MYLDHYGMREAPFRLTPLTDFFFTGARRGATVEAVMYAVLHDEGIIRVSGEVGTGKTMLSRVLIDRFPDDIDTLYCANPTLEPDELLRALATELGLSLDGERTGALLGAIQDALIERHAGGRRVVALIDEAHAMPKASLEQIRLLSNLETGRHKLLQLVLFGQPELDEILARRDMRQLKDRITQHFRLNPMTADEVADYLDFRMRAAGYRGPAVFSPAATRRVTEFARGLTRRINVLADKSLLAAFTQNLHAVNPTHVATAARDAEYAPAPRRRLGWLIAPVALAIGALVLWQQLDTPAPGTPPTAAPASPPPADIAAAAAPPPAPRPVPAPTARPAAVAAPTVAVAPRIQPDAPPAEPTPPVAAALAPQPVTKPAPMAPPPEPPPPETAPKQPTAAPAAAAPTPVEPVVVAPEALPTPAAEAAPIAAPAPPATPAAPIIDARYGPLANAALAAQAAWMATAADEIWFIQLHTNTNIDAGSLEKQIETAHEALPGTPVRVYAAQLGSNARTGVVMGRYETEVDALNALRELPPRYRDGGAYVRQARRLR